MAGLIAGCGESKSHAAPPSPSVGASAPTAPAAPVSPAPPLPLPSRHRLPAQVEQPKPGCAQAGSEKIKRGEAVYRANCASCHGPNGEATSGWRTPGPDGRYPPPPLDGSAHAFQLETLEKMIREGSPAPGGMPPWDGKLTNQQIDDVIVWIKSLWADDVYDIWFKEIEQKPQPKQN